MDLAGCPRCGSLDMRPPTIGDGLWPGGGDTQNSVCHACAYRGMPLMFDNVEEYQAFREGLRATVTHPESTPPSPQEPVPQASSASRQRAMPLFVGSLAAVIIMMSLLSAVTNLVGLGAPATTRASVFVVALTGLLVGLAFLRIAVRAWRGTPA